MPIETPIGSVLFDRSGQQKVTGKKFKEKLSAENLKLRDKLTKTKVSIFYVQKINLNRNKIRNPSNILFIFCGDVGYRPFEELPSNTGTNPSGEG